MPVTTAPGAREKRRTASRKTSRRRDSRRAGFFAVWWPLLLGIAVTPFAIHAASIVALAGPRALMTLYPWVLLLKSPAIGLGPLLGENLSQLLMYIQFPIYGALAALILRYKSLWTALGITVAIHIGAVAAAFLMTNANIV